MTRLVLHNPDVVAAQLGRDTHAVETPPGAGLIFLSGQVPVRRDGSAPETLAEQADQVYATIAAILGARGVPVSNIAKIHDVSDRGR